MNKLLPLDTKQTKYKQEKTFNTKRQSETEIQAIFHEPLKEFEFS